MARILGLDLGSYSVKGLVLDSSGRTPVPKAYAEVRRPEGEPEESLRAALHQLLTAHPELRADQVIIALPGASLATHQLTLPFNDPKRLDSVVPFEVEGQLPYDLSDAVFDYQVVAQKEKASDLLVGVVRKDELAPLLALLAELKLDPRIVTHPGVAYQNLLLQHPALFDGTADAEAVALVDIGQDRTTVAIGKPGVGVEFARTFAGGGRELTRALAAEFHTPLPEAHHWKEAHGAMASAAQGPDAERAAAAFVRGMQPLLRELRPTLRAYTARTRKRVGAVFVCGGSARMPGLAEQLGRDLNLPTSLLPLPAEVAGVVPPEVQPSATQAYALALRGAASGTRAPRFNLRRGEFSFKGSYDYVRDRLGLVGAFAATLLVLLIVSGIVRNQVLARRERQVDAMLCETTQRILGTCETNYDRALNLLRGQESPAAALPKVSAVEILAELTGRIPADVPVTFDRILVDPDRVQLQGTTDNSKQIDAITSALRSHRCFREVQEGKVERTRDGQKVTFRLSIQVQCPAEARAEG
jgi:general secretion pathway protein L